MNMMDEARVCSRCQKQTCTPGQRYCKDCKRASKLKNRPSWVGGISAILRRRSIQPPPVETERANTPVSQTVEPAKSAEGRRLALTLPVEVWSEVMENAAHDGMSVDQYMSQKVLDLSATYAWFGLLPQTPNPGGMA